MLVIMLIFIVLLTAMVVAYFSYSALQRQISQSSVNQQVVSVFAQGAVHTIIGDMRQEIALGSTKYTFGTNEVFYPLSPTNMVPARVGTDNALPNLVKRSAFGQPFAPGGASRASGASSSAVSQNGRSVSPARWNAALLLPKADTNSATDFTPRSTFAAPDWVLVARDGSNPTTWNASLRWSGETSNTTAVVGRYAYAIYDEGGLLDVNAAGYPPGAAPHFTADKGGLAYADLTAVPGLSANAVSTLVGWRNYASAQPAGTFPGYTFGGAAHTNYFRAAERDRAGYLRAANTALFNGQSDRPFVSRQQLIQFLTQGVAGTDAEKAAAQHALQYLGTFSRDVEQPSFRPAPTRPKNTTHRWTGSGAGIGGNDAYDPTGAVQDLINPELLKARDVNGLPVMKRRFPLSRIALIKAAPTVEEAAKIYDAFGLTWDAPNRRWNYNHGTPNQILKLSEIPAGREPDFFETLKAVIHCDTLGKQYGGTGSNGSPRTFTGTGAALDGVINYQIIQIGANIIDQYDADSYPTAIAFTDVRIYYGVENLPYLAGWMYSWYRMRKLAAADIDPARQPPKDSGGNSVFPWEVWTMFQPILWNPHAPDAGLDTAQVPVNFRVAASSMTGVPVTVYPVTRNGWWGSQATTFGRYPVAPGGTLSPLTWAQSVLSPASSLLTFNATPNTTAEVPASFQEPQRLLYRYPAGSNADSPEAQCKFTLDALGPVADPVLAANDATYDGKTILGFFGGKCWAGPWNSAGGPFLNIGYCATTDVQLTLQYQDAAGDWLPYDVVSQVYTSGNTDSTTDAADTGTNIRAFVTGMRADPRTERWGIFTMLTFPLAPNPATPIAAPIPPSTYIYRFPQGTTLSPNSGMNAGFIYRLSRNAAGNPLVDWGTSIYLSDLSVNDNRNSTGASAFVPGGKFFYNDPDHVLRRADGGFKNTTLASQNSNGLPHHRGNHASRPVVLNRPFRSVAELGHVFSDTPWKSLNLHAPESGDAALLDAFCLHELDNAPQDVTVAGRLSLNTRQVPVLAALLRGVSRAEGGVLSDAEADRAAQALVDWTTDTATTGPGGALSKGPLRNRSELVGKFLSAVTYANTPTSSNTPNIGYDGRLSYSGFASLLTDGPGGIFALPADGVIKRRRECVMRALADAGNTRTWNLLIDVVAQVGRYPNRAASLDQFVVEGETRLWVHVAIDRFTGQVISRQWEPVGE
ncbi:hypothetical protein DB346_07275 [Verrucomicrobia bacterium LW23]|nr:hypothetical protein DB346_07275 [Verrucomicrobia bacterium LW23]